MRGDWVRGLAACAPLLAAMACNAVTGADGIELTDDDGEEQTSTSGAGGTGSVSAANATTAVSGSSGPGSTSASSGAMASSSSGTNCQWPTGPYGVGQGDTLPSSLKWQGYPAGSQESAIIEVAELFDCDGTKGITAVLFDTSQHG